MVIQTQPDIAGDNAVHALGPATAEARMIVLTALVGVARFGDASVSATQGVELPAGIPVTFRASEADRTDYFNLAQAKAYVPTGTTLTITTGI